MPTPPNPRSRAKLARFAARLGVLDLSTLDADLLTRFSASELAEAAAVAGWKTGKPLDRDALVARVRKELGHADPPAPRKKRAMRRTYRIRAVEPRRAGKRDKEEVVVPWGYGVDRIRAMAVDPERLFVYWEITDEAIARAREQLGPEGPRASLALRVYDVSGRIFDGTNAHGSFDHVVSREDRQWFFEIGKPSSEACLEVGLRSDDGRFLRIARSGRVEFPPRVSRPPRRPAWLTVRAWDGQAHPSADPCPDRAGGGESAAPEPVFGDVEAGVEAWGEPPRLVGGAEGGPVVGWIERRLPEGTDEEIRVRRWEGSGSWSSWEAGPFRQELDAPDAITESFSGGTRFYRVGGRTHIVYGPWEVVIRGLAAYRRRAVLSRWEIHRSWVSEEGHEVKRTTPVGGTLMAGSSAALRPGASERRWRAGSELRLGGASELLWMGASERRLGGASERMYQAASEWRLRGASERRFRGASERLYRGASEQVSRGASERLYRGASERLHRGASERRRRPANERAYPHVPDASDDGR
jgi:hypothetical protein